MYDDGVEIGDFGVVYREFYHQPREAILHLMRVKDGECPGAMWREDVGDIDLIWGEVTNPIKHKGYGLAHIIDKHGETIKELGYEIEDFLPILIEFGSLNTSRDKSRYILDSKYFRAIVGRYAFGHNKQWILTAFDLK